MHPIRGCEGSSSSLVVLPVPGVVDQSDVSLINLVLLFIIIITNYHSIQANISNEPTTREGLCVQESIFIIEAESQIHDLFIVILEHFNEVCQ